MADDLFVCQTTKKGTSKYLVGNFDKSENILTITSHTDLIMSEVEMITFGKRGREVNPCATSVYKIGEVIEENEYSLKIALNPDEAELTTYAEEYKKLEFFAEVLSDKIVNISIKERDTDRFEVPFEI